MENQWKSMKINENQWKSMDFQWKSIEIDVKLILDMFSRVHIKFFVSIGVQNIIFNELVMILTSFWLISDRFKWKINGESMKINENQWKSMEINTFSIKININRCKTDYIWVYRNFFFHWVRNIEIRWKNRGSGPKRWFWNDFGLILREGRIHFVNFRAAKQ